MLPHDSNMLRQESLIPGGEHLGNDGAILGIPWAIVRNVWGHLFKSFLGVDRAVVCSQNSCQLTIRIQHEPKIAHRRLPSGFFDDCCCSLGTFEAILGNVERILAPFKFTVRRRCTVYPAFAYDATVYTCIQTLYCCVLCFIEHSFCLIRV